jgi:hypothetical protein
VDTPTPQEPGLTQAQRETLEQLYALDAALRALDGGQGPLTFFEWFAAHPEP